MRCACRHITRCRETQGSKLIELIFNKSSHPVDKRGPLRSSLYIHVIE